jgi:hypothetical protein
MSGFHEVRFPDDIAKVATGGILRVRWRLIFLFRTGRYCRLACAAEGRALRGRLSCEVLDEAVVGLASLP